MRDQKKYRRNRSRKIFVVPAAVAAAALILFAAGKAGLLGKHPVFPHHTSTAVAAIHPDSVLKSGGMLPGTKIDGQDVGGMTAAEAEAVIADKVGRAKKAKITLYSEAHEPITSFTAEEIGLDWGNPEMLEEMENFGRGGNPITRYKAVKDLEQQGLNYEVEFKVNDEQLRAKVADCLGAVNRPAVDAQLKRENGVFQFIPGQTGKVLDVEATVSSVKEALGSGWTRMDLVIPLVITIDEPKGNGEELSRIKDLLGSFTTSYQTSGNARTLNIINGCKLSSGEILYPGETFSMLKHLTPFTEENGYQLAGSYLGNKVVDSLGGGICQVSTTLYNAVIRAELEVVERYNHSMIVGYVEASADAAIAESSGMDFKFRNNLDYPVYIEGITQNRAITYNIYGVETRPASRQIRFESEVLETIPSEGSEVETDPTQPVGYVAMSNGYTGYRAQLWKVVTENGNQVSREVFNKSSYRMTPAQITVGTAGIMTAGLQNAIASKDINAIRSAAAFAAANQLPADALTEAASEAAQEAYQEALASGMDSESAQAQAKAAADSVVSSATQQLQQKEAEAARAAAEAEAAAQAENSSDAEMEALLREFEAQ